MSDLFDARKIPLHKQIECAERELGMRKRVYPRWVQAGKMTQTDADRETAAMEAIVETLKELRFSLR